MQESNLHKLGKTDLLTIIYEQEKQIEKLTKEVQDLKQQLDNRTIQIKEAGSIAEASLKINKIFEVAQAAADEYLRSIKEVNKPSHECAQIDETLSKDKAIKSQDTYENHTEDKISKELILVNNKLMRIKSNLFKTVLIFLMFIFTNLKVFAIMLDSKIKNFAKRLKLNAKVSSIKYKRTIIKISLSTKSKYDKIRNRTIGFIKCCKAKFFICLTNAKVKAIKTCAILVVAIKNIIKYILHKTKKAMYCLARQTKITTYYIANKTKSVIYYVARKIKSISYCIACKAKSATCYLACKTKAFIKYVSLSIKCQISKFIQCCKVRIIILKFKIQNARSYKQKLLEKATDEKKQKAENALLVINNSIALYKINILQILKKVLKLILIKAIKVSKNIATQMYLLTKFLHKKTVKLKAKALRAFNRPKEFVIIIILKIKLLKNHYKKCTKMLKAKLKNKIHKVRLINETNEQIHIEIPQNALIISNNKVRCYKPKVWTIIVIKLKNVLYILRLSIIKATKKIKRLLYTSKVIIIKIACKIKNVFKPIITHVKTKTKYLIVIIQKAIETKQIDKKHIINSTKDKKQKKKNKKEKTDLTKIKISLQDLEKELNRRKEKTLKITFARTMAFSIMVIVAFAIITSTMFFKILQVSGNSMEPNLHAGELLITSKFFKFEKGDMIAFYYNDSVLIKRVIAIEGDTIYIEDDGQVYVNSVKLEEGYVKELSYGKCDIEFPYQVPEDSVFILGDNREVSIDSRSKSIGCISKDKILGKIQFKLNPFVIY